MANSNASTRDRRDDEPRDLAPDLLGVKSRVSWSAIIGGSMIAIACYLALTLLLGAIGVTLTETNVRGNTIAIGILVAMIIAIVLSLFLGGWVSAQLTAGENRQEAVIYGLLTWATFMAAALFMVGMGVRAGYFAVVGGSMVAENVQNNAQAAGRPAGWEDLARQAGVSDASINAARSSVDPARVRAEVNDPANQERAREAAIAASWTALVATMLSMAAAVGGALVGRGTAFRLFPRVVVRSDTPPRIIVPTA
jgi:hypothetical protein